MTTLIRVRKVCTDTGRCKSSIYADIKIGLFTPPIKIGSRASAWLDHEVHAINSARIAGLGVEEIRNLVTELVEARSQIMELSEGEVRRLVAKMVCSNNQKAVAA